MLNELSLVLSGIKKNLKDSFWLQKTVWGIQVCTIKECEVTTAEFAVYYLFYCFICIYVYKTNCIFPTLWILIVLKNSLSTIAVC